jgi:hypothetical protein
MSFASLFSAAETTVAPVKSDVAIAAVHKMLINFFSYVFPPIYGNFYRLLLISML